MDCHTEMLTPDFSINQNESCYLYVDNRKETEKGILASIYSLLSNK